MTLTWWARDKLFLPDTDRWGRGYGGMEYSRISLRETYSYIHDTMQRGGLPGYKKRGFIQRHPQFARLQTGNFILPPGFDAESPGRKKAPPELVEPNPPTSTKKIWRVPEGIGQYYRDCGYPIDQHGRAVHPRIEDILKADNIPICTGLGVGWEGGETIVVDTVVTDGDFTLFNTRKDHGQTIPSLIGGYSYATDFTTQARWRAGHRPITIEGIFAAVRRIVKTKAGIDLPANARFEIVWGIRPWSSAHTANFWTLTYTVRVRLGRGASKRLVPQGSAFWQHKDDMDRVVDNLWPDHRRGYNATVLF